MDLADVLLLAGKKDEAIAVFRSAQELYEQKGNIVSSRGVTRLLAELERG
jgi:hypothetical protein